MLPSSFLLLPFLLTPDGTRQKIRVFIIKGCSRHIGLGAIVELPDSKIRANSARQLEDTWGQPYDVEISDLTADLLDHSSLFVGVSSRSW